MALRQPKTGNVGTFATRRAFVQEGSRSVEVLSVTMGHDTSSRPGSSRSCSSWERPATSRTGNCSIASRAAAQVPKEASSPTASKPDATGLALRAHAQAAAFDKLPRFSYRVKYRHGVVNSLRAVDMSFDRLKEGLTAPVLDTDWVGWYETSFSWDEKRFLWEMLPGETSLNFDSRFWTRTDAWERHEANDHSSVNFVRAKTPGKLWKSVFFFDYSYLRLTPHRYWWGLSTNINGQTMSLVPPELATWSHLGVQILGARALMSSIRHEEPRGSGSGEIRDV